MHLRCTRKVVSRVQRHCAEHARKIYTGASRTAEHRVSGHAVVALIAAATAVAALPFAVCYYDESDPNKDRLARWKDRWKAGQLNWHRSEPYRALVDHYDQLTGGKPAPEVRVLVPLCGKSVDLPYLANRGHETVGVEGVEAAVWALQRENWLDFTRVLVPRGGGGAPVSDATAAAEPQHDSGGNFLPAAEFGGARKGYVFTRGARGVGYYRDAPPLLAAVERRLPLRVVVGDFLEVTPAEIGTFDAAWDRGSLVALPPGARARYAATLAALLRDGARVLLVTSDFDQSVRPGPPFVVSHAELEALYGPLGFTVELLSSRDASAEYQGGPWDAVSSVVENCYLLTKRGSAAQRRWYKPWSWFRG